MPNRWTLVIRLLILFASSSVAAQSVTPVAVQQNAIQRAAEQRGVVSCSNRIAQVANFVGFGSQAGALLMAPSNQPDQRLVPLVMELPLDGGIAYVSASFAPNQANGCGATYDAVMYWPQSCDQVASKQFAQLKKLGLLKKDLVVLDGGISLKVFLMVAGSGCVSIKKEIVL